MEGKITVVITTHERPAETLKRAVDSAVLQTYSDTEIIIVNDSPENEALSEDIRRLAASYDDPRIVLADTGSSGGACRARNHGAAMGEGALIAFLDDDDEWLPEKLEKQAAAFTKPEIGLVYGPCFEYDSRNFGRRVGGEQHRGRVEKRLLRSNFIGGCSSVMLRREAFEAVSGFDEELPASQDYDLWLRIAQGYEVACVSEPLTNRYMSSDSISVDFEKKKQAWELFNAKHRDLYENDRRLYCRRLQSIISHSAELGRFDYSAALFKKVVGISPFEITNYAAVLKAFIKKLSFSLTDSVKMTIAQVLTLGVNMINVMLLSRFRTVEEYGTYSQMIMVSAIIIIFFASGFSQCVHFFLANERNELKRAQFIKTYYAITTVCSMIGGLLSVLLIPLFVRYFGNGALKEYGFFLCIYPISKILNDGADRFFVIYKRTGQLILFKARYAIATLAIIIVALILKWPFKTYMMAFCAAELVLGLTVYWFIYRISGVKPFGFDKETFKKIMRFAAPLGVAALVSIINKELDKLVVGGLTDTTTLALYTNAAKELPIVVFATSIATVVMPHVVKHYQNGETGRALEAWRSSVKLASIIMCFFCTALFAFAPQVISVLYSDKYLDGTGLFRIYLISELFGLTYYWMILNAENKTKTILLTSVANMVINLVLDLVLFKLIGLSGPAWATVISIAAVNMLLLFITKRDLGVRFTDVYPVAFIFQYLVLNAALGAAFWLIQQFALRTIPMNGNLLSVLLGVVWLGVYYLIVRKKVSELLKSGYL
ncbi:MAG: glycosyltransferase [Clostridia bacterium]|nr:glycosyltransferase [Clostridia bacterium]